MFEGVNKILLMAGLELTKEGKLVEAIRAKTLDEVDRRVNSLRQTLYYRAIHNEVEKYCILLESIFHLVRNPEAHTPKANWKVDETKALDILTLISFAHKHLDECYKMLGLTRVS